MPFAKLFPFPSAQAAKSASCGSSSGTMAVSWPAGAFTFAIAMPSGAALSMRSGAQRELLYAPYEYPTEAPRIPAAATTINPSSASTHRRCEACALPPAAMTEPPRCPRARCGGHRRGYAHAAGAGA